MAREDEDLDPVARLAVSDAPLDGSHEDFRLTGSYRNHFAHCLMKHWSPRLRATMT